MTIFRRFAAVLLLFCAGPAFAQTGAGAHATYQLKPTPKTVTWGYYSATAAPVLRIHSGDTVEIQTLLTSSPTRLAAAGVPADQIEQSLRDIFDQVKDRGPGGHILTGPVYVEGAQPGDVLEVRIEAIRLGVQDYLVKGTGGRMIARSIRYAMERKQSEEALLRTLAG